MPTRLNPPILLATLFAAVAIPATAAAQDTIDGMTAGGAYYRITMPAAWNGQLVIWNHGFDLSELGAVTDLGPLVAVQLGQGYAVAASSYRQRGWALFKTVQDLKALVGAFRANFGEPSAVILYGASLGGIVTVQALEKGIGANVTGALTYCGALAGSRNWDGALDIRLLYDAVCGDVPGAAIPGGPEGLPDDSDLTAAEVSDRLNACTGLDLKKAERTREQKARLRTLVEVSQVPEEFLDTDMWYVTFGLADLVHDRGKLRGKVGTGNANVDYGDARINADIQRVRPKNGPARKLAKFHTPSGRTRGAKFLALHTDKDGLVIVENLGEYRDLVAASGNGADFVAAVVAEASPTHCGFSDGEVVSAWQSFTSWLGGTTAPTVAHLQSGCQTLVGLGLAAGPCRFDPGYEIGDLDDKIRPR